MKLTDRFIEVALNEANLARERDEIPVGAVIVDKDYKNFRKLINSRLKRKPVAYLTGVKSFWKYDFKINEKVLLVSKPKRWS